MRDATSAATRCRRLLRKHGLWLTAVLTVAVFLGLFLYSDGTKLFTAFGRFSWSRFLLILGLTTVGYGFRFAKWEYYLREVNADVSLQTSLITFFSGLMMVVTPGKAGEVWKAWFLRDNEDIPLDRTTSIVGAERVTDLLALCILAALGVFLYSQSSLLLVIVVVTLVLGVVLLQWRRFCLRVLELCESVPFVGPYVSELETVYESTYTLFQTRPLIVALVLSLVAWGLEGVALWIVLQGLGVEAELLVAVFIFGLGSVVGAVSMLPGGLAAAEASMMGLLISFGYTKTVATAATILIRVSTLWYAAVLGVVVFLSYKAFQY